MLLSAIQERNIRLPQLYLIEMFNGCQCCQHKTRKHIPPSVKTVGIKQRNMIDPCFSAHLLKMKALKYTR